MALKLHSPRAIARICRLFSSHRALGSALFAVSWLRAAPSLAEVAAPVPSSFVFGPSTCPAPEVVLQAVMRLVPAERRGLLRQGVRVDLEDLAESYRVKVTKDGKPVDITYADPARDCAGRANFAAVFVVLTVMPPELGVDAVKDEPPVPPTSVPVAAPSPPRVNPAVETAPVLPLARVELGALFAAAPAVWRAPALDSFGVELRVALGRGAWSGTLSVAYTTPAHFELDGVRGEITRLPASAGLRFRSELLGWSLATDLGLLVTAERVHATNLRVSRQRELVDFGVHAGMVLAPAGRARVAPFVSLFAGVSPGPRELSALPRGTLGNLPYVWLGGALGVSLGL